MIPQRSLACLLLAALLSGALAVVPTRVAASDLSVECPGGVGDVAALRQAIADANASGDGDTLVLAEGCAYTLEAPASGENGLPAITGPLVIVGNGTTITRLNAPDVPAFRLLEVAAGASVQLSDLTLSNGAAQRGGGILNAGQLTLRDVTVADSEADDGDIETADGGGIYNGGQLVLLGASLAENAAGSGGGLANEGSVSAQGSAISGNRATDYSGGGGGGLLSVAGEVALYRTTVSGNTSETGGAGLTNGGGAQLVLEQSTVSGNSTPYGSGAGIINSGQLHVSKSTVSGNSTRFSGGGVYNGGVALLVNSTVSGNSSRFEGGGIYNSGALTLTLSTLAENSGAGTLYTAGGQLTALSNTVLSGSFVCYGAVSSLGHNLDSDGSCALAAPGDISGGQADLLPLADNGGSTATHALGPGSDARDAGDCADGTVLEDQRGAGRPAGPACDIGAVEQADADTTPPELTCAASPAQLWPPNHKLRPVTVNVSLTDSGSGPGEFRLISVTSSEPGGEDDIKDFAIGTPDTTGLLRAERAPRGTGRVYQLTYEGFDQGGNRATCQTEVTVPKHR